MNHSHHLAKPFPIPNPGSEILILLLPSLSPTLDEVPFPSSNLNDFLSLPVNSLLTLLPLVLIHLTCWVYLQSRPTLMQICSMATHYLY